jgi:putative membrane protein
MNVNVNYIVNSVVFSVLGLVVFAGGFWVFDKVTPYNLWREINQEKNVALAIVVGSISIGICIIIASAIHG